MLRISKHLFSCELGAGGTALSVAQIFSFFARTPSDSISQATHLIQNTGMAGCVLLDNRIVRGESYAERKY
jgi:hypothetical protein